MKLALVGYGKMGRVVEMVAVEEGHDVVARLDPVLGTTNIDAETLGGAEVAIDSSSMSPGRAGRPNSRDVQHRLPGAIESTSGRL